MGLSITVLLYGSTGITYSTGLVLTLKYEMQKECFQQNKAASLF